MHDFFIFGYLYPKSGGGKIDGSVTAEEIATTAAVAKNIWLLCVKAIGQEDPDVLAEVRVATLAALKDLVADVDSCIACVLISHIILEHLALTTALEQP
jgi:hypothetical protein